MSKIFDALKRAGDEQDPVLASLLDEELLLEAAAPPAAVAGAPRAAEILPAAPPPEPPARKPGQQIEDPAVSQIRKVPLRIPVSAPLLPFDSTHWHAAEQYRIVRTKIIQHPRQPRTLVVSSAGSGDGKSVTSVNIAGALSLKTEANVLLMDADFRRSAIHLQLGLPQSPGLADVLSGSCRLQDALVRTEQLPNLYVIPAGETKLNPTELLDSSRWRAVCEQLRSYFRYVVIDSPPIAAVADYDLIQAVCDGVIVVVRPDHTNRSLCYKALETVAKDKLIGVLLNCVEKWLFSKAYGYNVFYSEYYSRDTK